MSARLTSGPDPIEPTARFRYRVELDNYSPVPRSEGSGIIERYDLTDGRPVTYVIETCDGMRDATRAVFLFDDGARVVPLYVAGWNAAPGIDVSLSGDERAAVSATPRLVYLHPFPLSSGTRPDNGRPVDMSGWALGPRRAYHLKVTAL